MAPWFADIIGPKKSRLMKETGMLRDTVRIF